jgi:hypothetical protein
MPRRETEDYTCSESLPTDDPRRQPVRRAVIIAGLLALLYLGCRVTDSGRVEDEAQPLPNTEEFARVEVPVISTSDLVTGNGG